MMKGLRGLREGFGLTINGLANRLGMAYQSLQGYEAGKNANLRTAQTLADYFGVGLDELCGHTPVTVTRDDRLSRAVSQLSEENVRLVTDLAEALSRV